MDFKQKLFESSLSRIWAHFNAHDSAIITAFRHQMINCVNDADNTGAELSLSDNKSRNSTLKAALLKLGYGVTRVDGVFIENFNSDAAKEVKEDSMLVSNTHDNPNFISQIAQLGKQFCQDSVLIIPKGGQGAYLLGTNNSQFPGLDQQYAVGDFKPGKDAEFMSKVGNRPFHFGEAYGLMESYDKLGTNSRHIVTSVSKELLKKII